MCYKQTSMLHYYADNKYICMIFSVDQNLLQDFYDLGLQVTEDNYRNIFEMYSTKYSNYLQHCTYELYTVEIDYCNGRYVLEDNSQDPVYEAGIQCIDPSNRAIIIRDSFDKSYQYCIPDSNYKYKLRINIDKQTLINMGVEEQDYMVFEKLTNLISSCFMEIKFGYCAELFCTFDYDLIINTAQKQCILIEGHNSGCIYHSTNFLTLRRTNSRCINCIDCYDCVSCIDCRNCKTCKYCNYCSNCNNCSNCVNKHL